jgi:serine protease Do
MKTARMTAVLGACLALGALAPVPATGKDASAALEMARKLNEAFIEVAEEVSPAVVVVDVAHKPDYEPGQDEDNPFWDWLPPQFRRQLEERFRERRRRPQAPVFDGQGSGVVIRADGFILTNRHVVDGAEKIRVRFKSGKTYDAEVKGVDAQSDVAVIKIDARGLPVARFADSAKVRVGEFAIAIGAPFELDYSVTVGHVSAKGRSRVIPDASMDQDFIQTDASINPGNSGGPLVNIDGEIIGINTLIRGLRTGIGFAIPSNLAKEVADKLITEGRFTRAWLGVEIVSLSEYPEFKELAKGVEEGVVVRGIRQDGPAAKSDLKPRDVVTMVDGKAVATAQQLKNEIRTKPIGKPVDLDVVRNGKHLIVKVKPEEWPEEAQTAVSKQPAAADAESPELGLTVKPLTKELAKEYGVTLIDGLLVAAVEPGSLAHRKGIQRGDVITEINEKSVSTVKDYRGALKSADLKKGVIINLVTQEGVSKFVVLKDAGD